MIMTVMKLLISLILLVALVAGPSHSWVPSSSVISSRSQRGIHLSSSGSNSAEDAAASMIHQGTVKWFDTTKGFGFIVPSDGSSDVFVHQSEIQMQGYRSLADGEAVEYKIDVDPKTGRRKATRVTGPGGAPAQGAPFRPASDFEPY